MRDALWKPPRLMVIDGAEETQAEQVEEMEAEIESERTAEDQEGEQPPTTSASHAVREAIGKYLQTHSFSVT